MSKPTTQDEALERFAADPQTWGESAQVLTGAEAARSSRVNVAVDADTDTEIERVRTARGISRSARPPVSGERPPPGYR